MRERATHGAMPLRFRLGLGLGVGLGIGLGRAVAAVVASSVLALTSMHAGAGSESPHDPRQPVPIILDTDMESDVDDVGALAMLHALADRGEADILAVMVSTLNPHTAACADRINTYLRRPDLPIGQLKGEGRNHSSRYARQIAEEFPGNLASGDDAPDAVELYREILAAQPDYSVVIVSIGYKTNLRNLLASGPDAHSDLDGRALVERKVRLWVCMGGHFPRGREHNILMDTQASVEAVAQWPTEIVFSGWEIGRDVRTGARLAETARANPARRAYELFNNLRPHRSWDQAAVLYAVRSIDEGPASDYWTLSDPGRIVIDPDDGSNTWQDDPDGTHRYKRVNRSPELIAAEIDELMAHEPVAPVAIRSPTAQQTVVAEDGMHIEVILGTSRTPTQITLHAGDERIAALDHAPWIFNWQDPPAGAHELIARAEFEDGEALEGGAVPVHVLKIETPADLPAVTDGLVATYPLNEGGGRAARDRSGSGLAPDLRLTPGASWSEAGRGLHLDGSGAGALSATAPTALTRHLRDAGAFTIELWIEPGTLEQEGPARLVTLSAGTSDRNLTIGHGQHRDAGANLSVRLRTSETDRNGMPDIVAEGAIVEGPAQYAITYADETVTIYRNGQRVHTANRAGTLNWDEHHLLGLGAEVAPAAEPLERPWHGQLLRVAIYDRALDASEIRHSFNANAGD